MDPSTSGLLSLASPAQGGGGGVPSALPQNVDLSSSATATATTNNTFRSGDFNFKSSSSMPLLIGAGLLVVFLLLKK